MESIEELRARMHEAKADTAEFAQQRVKAEADAKRAEQQYIHLLEKYCESLEGEIERLTPSRTLDAALGDEWLDPDATFEKIVRDLSHGRSEEKAVAKRQLSLMGPKAIMPLVEIMRQEGEKRGKRIRNVGLFAIAISVFAIVEIAVPDINGAHNWLLLLMVAVSLLFMAPSGRFRDAANALRFIEDRRATPAMLRILDTREPALMRAVSPALIALLPKLRPSHASLFDLEDCACMHRYIMRGSDEALIVAMLAAIEQIGDATAMTYVSKLAEGEGPASWSGRVRGAAQDCVRALADNAIRNHAASMLLRATSGPQETPEALLRPASVGAATDTALLLRPTVDGGGAGAD